MKWDDVYGSFKRFAAHTAVRLNQTADIASLQVKLSAAEKNLSDAYGLLGRISYQHFSGDDDFSERVLAAVKAVDQAKEEVRIAEENLNEAKRRAEAQKAAYEADKAARAAKAEAAKRAEEERVAREAEAATRAEEERVAREAEAATREAAALAKAAREQRTQAQAQAAEDAQKAPVTSLSDADGAVEVEVATED